MTWIWQRRDWPSFRWDDGGLAHSLARARLAQGRILGALRALDASAGQEAGADLLVGESVATSAIEGETLARDLVRSSVARHLGLARAGLPPAARHVDGLVEVLLDATRRHREPLTLERLCAWQAALFPTGRSGLRPIATGRLRGRAPMRVVSQAAGRERIHFQAPPRARLPREVELFLAWFESPPPRLDGLLRAGLAHFWFLTLHPFEDGNGRVARALTDMALARDDGRPLRSFSLSSRIHVVREEYYAILESTQRGGLEVTRWLAWFLDQVNEACAAAEATLDRVLAKGRFWLRFRELDLNVRQRKALNRMLDAGPGGYAGGMTTGKYAHLTHSSRATASRELAALAAEGCLVPSGEGRGRRYDVRWPD